MVLSAARSDPALHRKEKQLLSAVGLEKGGGAPENDPSKPSWKTLGSLGVYFVIAHQGNFYQLVLLAFGSLKALGMALLCL